MALRNRSTIAVVIGAILLAAPAGAQEPVEADRLADLVVSLEDGLEALQSADCERACAALDSMRRSVDEICALDPGERCASSRDKVAAAAERVRARCPACDVVDDDRAPARADEKDEGRAQPVAVTEAAPAPPAADARGGCAACTVGHERGSGGSGWLALGTLFGLLLRRRRR